LVDLHLLIFFTALQFEILNSEESLVILIQTDIRPYFTQALELRRAVDWKLLVLSKCLKLGIESINYECQILEIILVLLQPCYHFSMCAEQLIEVNCYLGQCLEFGKVITIVRYYFIFMAAFCVELI